MPYWETVASGSSIQEFQNSYSGNEDLPAGTKCKLVLTDVPWYKGHLMDMVLAEQLAQYFSPIECEVTDVYWEGGLLGNGTGYIEFTAYGSPLLAIVGKIAIILLAVGILAIFVAIALQIERLDPTLWTWQIVLIIVIVVVVIAIVTVMVARRGKMGAGPIKVGG